MDSLFNVTDGVPVASRLTVCRSLGARTRGLIGTRRLEPGHLYWITPCNAIHTFFMFMTIDVAFVDPGWKVLKVIPSMTPFRVCLPVPGAAGVLEGAEGTLARARLRKGVQLELRTPTA